MSIYTHARVHICAHAPDIEDLRYLSQVWRDSFIYICFVNTRPHTLYAHLFAYIFHVCTGSWYRRLNSEIQRDTYAQRVTLRSTLTYVQIHSHMYRYIHICTDTFTYVQIHSHMYRYIHKCTDTFTYVQIHSHMYRYIHICTDTFTYVQIHSHMYRYIHICTDTSTYVQIHSHMYRYIHICADTFTYVQIHSHMYRYIHICTDTSQLLAEIYLKLRCICKYVRMCECICEVFLYTHICAQAPDLEDYVPITHAHTHFIYIYLHIYCTCAQAPDIED